MSVVHEKISARSTETPNLADTVLEFGSLFPDCSITLLSIANTIQGQNAADFLHSQQFRNIELTNQSLVDQFGQDKIPSRLKKYFSLELAASLAKNKDRQEALHGLVKIELTKLTSEHNWSRATNGLIKLLHLPESHIKGASIQDLEVINGAIANFDEILKLIPDDQIERALEITEARPENNNATSQASSVLKILKILRT